MENLTKREYFAGLAMQGILSGVYSNPELLKDISNTAASKGVAPESFITDMAIDHAELLMKQLNKK